jgi:hypothetical protein
MTINAVLLLIFFPRNPFSVPPQLVAPLNYKKTGF